MINLLTSSNITERRRRRMEAPARVWSLFRAFWPQRVAVLERWWGQGYVPNPRHFSCNHDRFGVPRSSNQKAQGMMLEGKHVNLGTSEAPHIAPVILSYMSTTGRSHPQCRGLPPRWRLPQDRGMFVLANRPRIAEPCRSPKLLDSAAA